MALMQNIRCVGDGGGAGRLTTTGSSLHQLRRHNVCNIHHLRPAATVWRTQSAVQVGPVGVIKTPQPRFDKLDVVALGNLCVDIMTPVTEVPAKVDRDLLDTLTAAPPDVHSWELGGTSNFLVTAARLGLRAASVGHAGGDVFGQFLDDELRAEGVVCLQRILTPPAGSSSSSTAVVGSSSSSSSIPATPASPSPSSSSSPPPAASAHDDATLLCFVLVDPASHHAFCSRYDFGPWPLLEGITTLPQPSLQLLHNSRAVFVNGFVFDELKLDTVLGASQEAIGSGAAIFFDPGPRCFTMMAGSRRDTLEAMMDLSEVVLMTEEEARIVTGCSDPEAAARTVLRRAGARTKWAVVKMGGRGSLLCRNDDPGVCRVGAFKVDVVDTVGCGDSFAAAVVLGYSGGHGSRETLTLASAVGAATATGRGAGRNVARADKVASLLRQAVSAGHGDSACCAAALRMLEAQRGSRQAALHLAA